MNFSKIHRTGRMKVMKGKRSHKQEYLRLQKESFPRINLSRDSKFFDEKIESDEIFVAEEVGEYAGHLCFGKHLHNAPFAGSVFIEEFAVKNKFRGAGIGSALMRELVGFCKRKKISSIYLGTGNKMRKYYEKQGFKKVGWLKDIDPASEYDHPQIFYAVLVKDWGKK